MSLAGKIPPKPVNQPRSNRHAWKRKRVFRAEFFTKINNTLRLKLFLASFLHFKAVVKNNDMKSKKMALHFFTKNR